MMCGTESQSHRDDVKVNWRINLGWAVVLTNLLSTGGALLLHPCMIQQDSSCLSQDCIGLLRTENAYIFFAR